MKKRATTDTDRLIDAAKAYIEARGGTAIVFGGIDIIQMPGDLEFNWRIALRITGKKPEMNLAKPRQAAKGTKGKGK